MLIIEVGLHLLVAHFLKALADHELLRCLRLLCVRTCGQLKISSRQAAMAATDGIFPPVSFQHLSPYFARFHRNNFRSRTGSATFSKIFRGQRGKISFRHRYAALSRRTANKGDNSSKYPSGTW